MSYVYELESEGMYGVVEGSSISLVEVVEGSSISLVEVVYSYSVVDGAGVEEFVQYPVVL